jgi:peptidoglycan/xylan/chitin deacetylase (PgdA/CDA1 family)
MYHSVGRVLTDWQWSRNLTIPWQVFEDHLRWLAKTGYRTAGFDALHAHVRGEAPLPERSVVLTFDDGYVDNWTYVVPLLEKYKMTGTVLVTPEFVDPRDVVRPTLADVWSGRAAAGELDVRGFMSWLELRAAVERGVLSAECHAMTHTWYPTGPTVIDFHHPGDAHYWLDWNAHPDKKPFYLTAPRESEVPWGTPVYEHAKSLEATRYFPNEAEAIEVTHHVESNGGIDFFNRAAWRDELHGVLERARSKTPPGHYEKEEERIARYIQELEGSKEIIAEKLGRSVEFLVWPNRTYNDQSMELARMRFKAVTVRAEEAVHIKNQPGGNAGKISRFGVPLIPRGGRMLHPGGRYLTAYLDEFRGDSLAKRKRQILKRLYVARSLVGLA